MDSPSFCVSNNPSFDQQFVRLSILSDIHHVYIHHLLSIMCIDHMQNYWKSPLDINNFKYPLLLL